MSGVAAVLFDRDRHEELSTRLATYTSRMSKRGPHGVGHEREGNVGLAHLRFDDGSSCTDPTGPWRLRPDGPILTGDLYLLNADAICNATADGRISQARAVLSAYDRWGTGAAEHLEGEFAFVLWDPAEKLLWAVRDRFGVRPLAYRRDAEGLHIATDVSALAEPADTPSPLWIAQFLAGEDVDPALTPFEGINRLAPGHMLICKDGDVSIRRWWSLEPEAMAPEKAPIALRERLQAAVESRNPPGAATFLSGGLDSSALTCLAARSNDVPVRAYSMRYPDMPDLDEGRYIDMVRALPNIDGRDIFPGHGNALENPDLNISEQGQPTHGMNVSTMRQGLLHIANDGVRVIIDGHGGDEVIGQGHWYMSSLAQSGKWLELLRLARAHSRFTGSGDTAMLMGQMMGGFGNRLTRRAARLLPQGKAADPFAWRDIVDDRLVASTDLVERVRARYAKGHADLPQSMRRHASMMVSPTTATAFEVLDRTAVTAGLVQRFPFYDRHVVAICLGQPDKQKIVDGQPRSLLRRSMKGILPEGIRLRPDKTDFMDELLLAFRGDKSGRIAQYRHQLPDRLSGYVDPANARKAAEMLMDADNEHSAEGIFRMWRIFWLDQWLISRENAIQNGSAPT